MTTVSELASMGITSLSDMVSYHPDGYWKFSDHISNHLPDTFADIALADIPDIIPVSIIRTGTCWSTDNTTLPYKDGVFEVLGRAPNGNIIVRIWAPILQPHRRKKAATNRLQLHPDSYALGSSTLLTYPYETLFPNEHCQRTILSHDHKTKYGVERSILATNPHTRPLSIPPTTRE